MTKSSILAGVLAVSVVGNVGLGVQLSSKATEATKAMETLAIVEQSVKERETELLDLTDKLSKSEEKIQIIQDDLTKLEEEKKAIEEAKKAEEARIAEEQKIAEEKAAAAKKNASTTSGTSSGTSTKKYADPSQHPGSKIESFTEYKMSPEKRDFLITYSTSGKPKVEPEGGWKGTVIEKLYNSGVITDVGPWVDSIGGWWITRFGDDVGVMGYPEGSFIGAI